MHQDDHLSRCSKRSLPSTRVEFGGGTTITKLGLGVRSGSSVEMIKMIAEFLQISTLLC